MQRAPSSPTISALGVHPLVVGGERLSKVFFPRRVKFSPIPARVLLLS